MLNRLNEISPPKAGLPRNTTRLPKRDDDKEVEKEGEKEGEKPENAPRDLYAILRDHAGTDEVLQRFWKEVNTVPDWVRSFAVVEMEVA